ncbi:hypothetical protein [Vibrio breoganii]|nr:hypothetical protein [Vibrio breoganii]
MSSAGEQISDQCAGPEKRLEMTEGCGEFAMWICGSMAYFRRPRALLSRT